MELERHSFCLGGKVLGKCDGNQSTTRLDDGEEDPMLPIRTIPHPTDFSACSDYAFRLACSVARDYGAGLMVLHAATLPGANYGHGVIVPPPEGFWEELCEKLRQFQGRDAKVQMEHQLADGDPVTEIVKVAQEVPCDLIVMGSHGRTGLSRLLMGSVVEGVVRKAPCPVLTVKTPFPQAEPASEPITETAGRSLEVAKT
jgi:nucleotide-binding universal stress UspA family protein